MNRNRATIVIVAIVCLAAVNVASCSSQSNHASASSSPNEPSPSPSPYLGIQKMWRGYDSAIGKSVAVFWVVPDSGMTMDATANKIFKHVEPDLERSAFQVFVVKVVVSQGVLFKAGGYVYVKKADGTWGRTDDQGLIDKIARTNFD